MRTEEEVRARIRYWEDTEHELAVLCDAAGRLDELRWWLNDKDGG
jgi:hypothetical protein